MGLPTARVSSGDKSSGGCTVASATTLAKAGIAAQAAEPYTRETAKDKQHLTGTRGEGTGQSQNAWGLPSAQPRPRPGNCVDLTEPYSRIMGTAGSSERTKPRQR